MTGKSEKEVVEIKSLLKLLDDEDEQVFVAARERLLSHNEAVLPYLPENIVLGTTASQRISDIKETILRMVFKDQFRTLKKDHSGDIDLEEGIILIAKQRFTGIDITPYITQLNAYALELKEKLSSITDKTEILRRTISFFVEEKGLTGNQTEYYSENNYFINRVLDTKLGIPITLSSIYLLVGKRIDLPIRGIGLPGHFILRFSFGTTNVYFDPFNNGKILSVNECQEMVKNLGFTYSEEYLLPVTNKQIIERMLRNIILFLEKKQETYRIETIRQYIDSLNSNV